MKNTLLGIIIAITLVALLEIGQIVTIDNIHSYININYFVKGAFLGLLLATISGIFFREILATRRWGHLTLSVLIFFCAVGSTIISFKFILAGLILHAFQCFFWDPKDGSRTVGMIGFDVVFICYIIYLEFINIGDQIFFI